MKQFYKTSEIKFNLPPNQKFSENLPMNLAYINKYSIILKTQRTVNQIMYTNLINPKTGPEQD